MRLVILESPYKGDDHNEHRRNLVYARAAMLDCFQRGDAPFVSHLLYTQEGVLRDEVENERDLGIEAGLLWGQHAEATVVYTDRGISPGMELGIKRARAEDRVIEFRQLLGRDW